MEYKHNNPVSAGPHVYAEEYHFLLLCLMKIELIISKYYRIKLDRSEVSLHFLMMQVKIPASELAGSGDGLGIIGTPVAAETNKN